MATTGKRTSTKATAVSARDAETDAEAPIPTDGRAARAQKTRTAIVDALLSLLDEGDLQPPATRIAKRAGISLRLIYHHFGDLESLYRATANREAERAAAMADAIDPSLALDERIAGVVAQRALMLEWITPVRRAALLQEPFSPGLTAARDAFYAIGEEQIREVFGPELAELDHARREAVVSALHGTLSWGCWNDLRISGRDPESAAAALDACVRALLGP